MEHITVEAIVKKDIETVWEHWTNPESIKLWAFASDDWEALRASNDMQTGGRFITTMAAKDGSTSFDFSGTYTDVLKPTKIVYEMDKSETDEKNRDCTIIFTDLGNDTTKITQSFYPETENSIELQKQGWQSILDNFVKFTESA